MVNNPMFIHLRARHDGKAKPHGGYTLAVKARPDGKCAVSICQCNTKQLYNESLGEKVAETRLGKGQFFVQDMEQLEATLRTLHDKLCTGHVIELRMSDMFPFDQPMQ
jgi:hypothetical protein